MATENPSGDTPPRSWFRLTGRSEPLDPRTAAARRDLADIRLADRVFAPHYAVPQSCGVIAPAPLLADPRDDAQPLSEVLPGEQFEVLEHGRDRAWGIAADGSVGYVAFSALGPVAEPTHIVGSRIADPRTAGTPLPMGARVGGIVAGGVLEAESGTYDLIDLRPLDRVAADPVAVAESLTGTPYRPAGRSGAGVHCSGLVYLAMTQAGRPCPRFRDGQAEMGEAVADDAVLQRGDVIVFADHVGLMTDADTLIHVTPSGVTSEPLASVAATDQWGAIIARRRP